MPRLTRSDRVVAFLESHWVECLTALYVLFVLQSTLVPFDFDLSRGPTSLYAITTGLSYWPDTVANIFLYFPFGVLLHWSGARYLRRRVTAIAPAVLLAILLSAATEWLQAYSPSRVSSLVDIGANGLGAALGALTSTLGAWSGKRLRQHLGHELRFAPRETILKGYCLLLVTLALVPFGILLDGPRLRDAFRESTFVPFEQSVDYYRRAEDARQRDNEHMYAVYRYQQMNLWMRWASEFASFVVLVWLLHSVLLGDYQFNRRGGGALTWWIIVGMALGLSLLQLPVRTRGFHVSDILMRLTGAGVGLFLRGWYIDRMSGVRSGRSAAGRLPMWCATAACVAVFLHILVGGLIPFVIDHRENLVSRAVFSENMLPFFSYFRARFDVAMGDLIGKGVSYAMFAALAAFCWRGVQHERAAVRMRAVLGLVMALALCIESAQVALLGRIPSLTDLIIAVVAGACGVMLHDNAVRFFRESTVADPLAQPSDLTQAMPQPSRADELLTGLQDPRDDAPREGTGRRTSTPRRSRK